MIQATAARLEEIARTMPRQDFARIGFTQIAFLVEGDVVDVKRELASSYPCCPDGTYTFQEFIMGQSLEKTVLLVVDRSGAQHAISPFHNISVWRDIAPMLNDRHRTPNAEYEAMLRKYWSTSG